VKTPGFLPRAQVAIGIGYLVLFVGFSLWARFEVPYRDDWDWMLATLTGPGGLAGLLQPHNEHVIPLARLLMSAQLATGGLTGHLVQYVALGCQLAVIWLFWREVARRWPGQPAWRWAVGGLVLVCLSLTQQLQSVVFAAAILFPLVQFWTTLAVVAWLNADEARSAGSDRAGVWWWGSVVCVAAAAASTTSGIVTPALLGLLAWLRGGRAREVVGWGVVTVALAAAYIGSVGPGAPTGGSGVVEPWSPPSATALVAYALAVLSAGATYANAAVAILLGVIVLAVSTGALLTALRRRPDLERVELFAVAQIVFGLACTLMVTPGRAQFGLLQGAQSRYATFVLCVWAAVAIFVASRASRGTAADNAPARPLQWVVIALSLLLVIPNTYMGVLWWAKADNLNAAHLALRSGVPDPVWLKTLHPLPVVIDRTLQAMTSRGMPVVDAAMHTGVSALPAAECQGTGRLVRQSRSGGLVFEGRWSTSLTQGLLIDASGAVVGFAGPAPWVREPAPSPTQVHAAVMRELRGSSSPDNTQPWIGFAQPGTGGPYRFAGSDDAGTPDCVASLPVTSAVHATLDRIDVRPGNVVQAAGWAFACGEEVAAWTLEIDAQSLPATVLARIPRPDVDAAFSDGCVADAAAGVHLQAHTGLLSPGPHTATLRVVSASGSVAVSEPVTFVVPAGAAR
jgi:hypothetical protein